MPPAARIFLMSLAANLDNLAVGAAYGLRRVRVPPLPNLVVAAMAFALTYTAATAGAHALRLLGGRSAGAVGALLLAAVGAWVLWLDRRGGHPPSGGAAGRVGPRAGPAANTSPPQSLGLGPALVRVLRNPGDADLDGSGALSVPEALVLGLALGANCLAGAFSAGLWGLSPLAMAVATAAGSYLTLWGGAAAARRWGARLAGPWSGTAAGCLLLALALYHLLAGE